LSSAAGPVSLIGRFGAKHAREKVSAAPGTFIVDNALEVMQIDHTQVDLHVVDEEYRRPIGRPWITVATDVPTRMVWGIYLTLDEPSEVSVALCLAHAVLPKEAWLLERKIQAEWVAIAANSVKTEPSSRTSVGTFPLGLMDMNGGA